ncbi:O-acetylhomoserine (thiol)-lyase [Papillibacter cinnamivorans DSM 12816]|uniref:O-acetylhomoserine (Thiol)-lyase n=1 Tax=Papillibacter cinnamivorans DSM 12816 TaxID=1122930 RepID=A0A1W2AUE8_9FIRM|nr:O-acetylhomoserine (thiol)-lyase [Papillibacter cinnamivorans DSM 12816]
MQLLFELLLRTNFRFGRMRRCYPAAKTFKREEVSPLKESYHFETLQVHAGQESPDSATDARAVPIYATTSYVFKNSAQAAGRFGLTESGNIYTRLTNPTTSVFETRIAALEKGAGALATASGSAAITCAVQNIALAGDHIVSAQNLYGGTRNLFSNTLREQGIEVTYADSSDPSNFEAAIKANTKLLFAETLGNPNSDAINLEAVSGIAHAHGIPLIVDSTFATPYLLRPIEHGADVVVHSATKFIGGHGTVMGGVIVDSGNFDWARSGKFPGLSKPNPSYHGVIFTEACGNLAYIVKLRTTLMRDQGAALSPFNSFLLLQGLETLSLRVERHVENALKVVEFLKNHPQVKRVNHPSLAKGSAKELYDRYFPKGAASIFTFEIWGDAETAKKFTESLELFSLLANVADVKSLVIHPASTTHSQLTEAELLESGIQPNTVRLSIGTEHIDDILADLSRGFEAIKEA